MVRLFTLLLLQFIMAKADDAQVQAYGHIFFKPGKSTPTQVNPKIVRFYRHFDLTILSQSLKLMQTFQEQYGAYCHNMSKLSTIKPAQIKVFKNIPSIDGKTACTSIGFIPLIVTNPEEEEQAIQVMREKHLTHFLAAVYLNDDNNMYSRLTDKQLTNLLIKACSHCEPRSSFKTTEFRPLRNITIAQITWTYELLHNRLVYYPNTYADPNIAVLCSPITETQTSIIKVVSQSCNRDKTDITRTNDMLQIELDQLIISKIRSKRSLALVGAGILGLDMVVGGITGQSPLSGIGQTLAHSLGIATHKDLQITRDELEKHAFALKNLSLNQQELVKAQLDIQNDIATLQNAMNKMAHHIEILYGEIDVKTNVYRMQDLIQQTILKIVVAMQAAKNLQTSPYVFGRKDLTNITAMFRLENIPLSTNIEDVITSMIIVEQAFTFIIAVPIVKSSNNFHFYEVLTLPVFKDGEGYRVYTPNQYIAINAAGNEYTIVSPTEYTNCVPIPLLLFNKHD